MGEAAASVAMPHAAEKIAALCLATVTARSGPDERNVAHRILDRRRRLHFVGIGGAGMSGIAELCQRLGFEVSGCDLHADRDDRAAGGARDRDRATAIIRRHLGAELDAVVISSAVKFSNPEVAAARALKIPVIRARRDARRIDPDGATWRGRGGHPRQDHDDFADRADHGRGRTRSDGRDRRQPARARHQRSPWRGDFMVAEADESDASFLLLLPAMAVVTNIDPEHLDHYGTMDRVREAFLSFINRIPFYGAAVLGHRQCERARAAAGGAQAHRDLRGSGRRRFARREDCDRRPLDPLRGGARRRRRLGRS